MPTIRSQLPTIDANQASQDVTHNEALFGIDCLMNLAVASVTTPSTTPPGSPTDGLAYLLAASPTGAWSGQGNKIAYFMQGWYFFTPPTGQIAYGLDNGLEYKWTGATWTAFASVGSIASDSDVVITTVADNDIIAWDSGTSKYTNQDKTELGFGTVATLNTGTSAGNVPVLDGGGKLDTSIMPLLVVINVFTVANQAARLALTAQPGDVAIQTDTGESYILGTAPASTNGNWVKYSISAGMITAGILSTARLGTGTATSATALFGDNTWRGIVSADITDATSTATGNRVVKRDSSGSASFNSIAAAGAVTAASFSGPASATNLSSGTAAAARLGSGSGGTGSLLLRDNQTWSALGSIDIPDISFTYALASSLSSYLLTANLASYGYQTSTDVSTYVSSQLSSYVTTTGLVSYGYQDSYAVNSAIGFALSSYAPLNTPTFMGTLTSGGDIVAGFGSDSTRKIGIGTDGSFASGKTAQFLIGDTNHGMSVAFGDSMQFAAYNGYYFQTRGSTKMTLGNDGLLGVGISLPLGKIHAQDLTATTSILIQTDGNSGRYAGLSLITDYGYWELTCAPGGGGRFQLIDAGTGLMMEMDKTSGHSRWTGTITAGIYTVGTLPTAGVVGKGLAFASNGRKPGEGVGSGTGVYVFDDGSAWISVCSGAAVAV